MNSTKLNRGDIANGWRVQLETEPGLEYKTFAKRYREGAPDEKHKAHLAILTAKARSIESQAKEYRKAMKKASKACAKAGININIEEDAK